MKEPNQSLQLTAAWEIHPVMKLPALNESLKAKGQQPISPPPAKVAVFDTALSSGGGSNRSGDPDAPGARTFVPADISLLH